MSPASELPLFSHRPLISVHNTNAEEVHGGVSDQADHKDAALMLAQLLWNVELLEVVTASPAIIRRVVASEDSGYSHSHSPVEQP
ncbi:MAG: hypothetical protein M1337_06335 [Actinobacteria bacterium]|nr:hypothetical protein [Actinomycetota bacterium]